jgi:hypothetical protein
VSDNYEDAGNEKYIAGAVFVEPGGREGVCIFKEHADPISAKRKADERTGAGFGEMKRSIVTRTSSHRIIHRG